MLPDTPTIKGHFTGYSRGSCRYTGRVKDALELKGLSRVPFARVKSLPVASNLRGQTRNMKNRG